MVVDMFPINTIPTVILFDSRASHSIISKNFAKSNNFPISLLHKILVIQTPGYEIRVKTICSGLTILINQVEFPANLVVLNSPKLDAILGMDWLFQHVAYINCADRSVNLINPRGKKVSFMANETAPRQGMMSRIIALGPSNVPVQDEFADVFPEELPCMPLDRE